MNDELAAIAGKYEELVGKLQERYGIASDRSKQQLDDFKKLVIELKKSNAKLMVLQSRLNSIQAAPRRTVGRVVTAGRRRVPTAKRKPSRG